MATSRDQVQIDSGYGGFAIRGEHLRPSANDSVDTPLVQIVETDGYELLVKAGSHWGPYDLVTERLTAAPPPVADEWEDVVELSVRCASGLAVMELDDGEPLASVTGHGGEFRLRVSARGRAEGQLRDRSSDDTEGLPPVEHFLLQSWEAPMSEHQVVRLTARLLTEAELNPPVAEEGPGLLATRAIGRDIDGAPGCRVLSGRTGSIAVSRVITGTRRRLFRSFAYGCGWTGGYMFWGHHELAVGHTCSLMSLTPVEDGGDGFTGKHAFLDKTWLAFRSPAFVVMSWAWMKDGRDPNAKLENSTPFLPEATTVRFDLTEHKAEEGGKETDVAVQHDSLPEEWLEDMAAYWRWMLAIAEARGFGIR